MKEVLSVLTVCSLFLSSPCFPQDYPKTRAERTDYNETSTNADVIAFVRELAASSNEARLTYIGESAGGNAIPLLILARPVPASPAALIGDNRICVYVQANIHAGEVEGKEAVLMLARDILLGEYNHLLDKLVVLIVPNINPDGNDKISPEHRSYQGGPAGGVGLRYNDQNLDLNRDWIKLETPENQAVATEILNKWDPALVIDCHTTNGSPHREPLTYAPSFNPNGDAEVMLYNRDVLLACAAERLKSKYGYYSIPYGNFVDRLDPSKGWSTFGHEPRYTNNYIGLRNRLAVLIETYAFADFRTRVLSSYGFLESILHCCSQDSERIARLIKEADARAYSRITGLDPQSDRFIIAVELKSLPELIQILGYEMEAFTDEQGRERARPTEKEVTYTVPYYGEFVATGSVPLPALYFIPIGASDIVKNLRLHGILVERLLQETEIPAQRFQLSELKLADNSYQGHSFTQVKGRWEDDTIKLPVGTYVVKTAQPLGKLAAYLLEPESDDGLLFWNFFDRYLTRQWGGGLDAYPVLRAMKAESLPTELEMR